MTTSLPADPTPGEPDTGWRTASRCGSSGCVEVKMDNTHVTVRNSKQSGRPVITYTWEEWQVFVAGVKAGEFDG